MTTPARNSARARSALTAWWLSSALGELGAATVHRMAFARAMYELCGATDAEIDAAYSDRLVLSCWHDFLRAEAASDRSRIVDAALTRLLQLLPRTAAVVKEAAEVKGQHEVKERVKARPPVVVEQLHATDSFYYAGTPPQWWMIPAVVVLGLVLLKACSVS